MVHRTRRSSSDHGDYNSGRIRNQHIPTLSIYDLRPRNCDTAVTSTTPPDPITAFVDALHAGHEPGKEVYQAAVATLRLWLSRRRLSPEDLDDVCSEAMLRLTAATRSGGLNPARPPGAWLRVVADHLAIDVLRRRARGTPVPYDERLHSAAGAEDEQLAWLIVRLTASDQVRRAVRAAVDDGEHTLATIITTWIGMAEPPSDPPTTRDVGKRLGISHTTVHRALLAFAEYLDRDDDVPQRRPAA